jgi:hypothetical protein
LRQAYDYWQDQPGIVLSNLRETLVSLSDETMAPPRFL